VWPGILKRVKKSRRRNLNKLKSQGKGYLYFTSELTIGIEVRKHKTSYSPGAH
jgi:hypothetical protein